MKVRLAATAALATLAVLTGTVGASAAPLAKPIVKEAPSGNSWTSFTLGNSWTAVPGITRVR